MVKKIVWGLALILLLAGFSYWNGTEYTISDDQITFAWDASSGATYYKVRLVWIDPTKEFIYDIGTTEQTELSINRPRAGHFRFEVCACDDQTCSEWANSASETYGQVDGEARGWRVYWRIPPPSDPVIE